MRLEAKGREEREEAAAALSFFISETLTYRVETCRRFVQQDKLRVADQRHSNAKLPLHAAAQLHGKLMLVRPKLHLFDGVVDQRLDVVRGDAAQSREEPQVVETAQTIPERVMLRHDAEVSCRKVELRQDAVSLDVNVSSIWVQGAHDH